MKEYVEYCKYCGNEKAYYDTTEEAWIEIDIHKKCKKIAEFEKLSIFDKSSASNTFEIAEACCELEKLYIENFKKYCRNFQTAKNEGVGMFFTGNAGTGKTFYSNCISNELKKNRNTVLSFNLTGYFSELRQGFDEKEKKILDAIKTVDIVIIDDIGNEKLTEWTKEKLFNLVNSIYLHRKPVIFSSNLTGNKLKEHFDMNGSDKIVDRLLELCKGFSFSWESRRVKKGKEKFAKVFD